MDNNPAIEPETSGEDKQFTQADVDRIVGKRLSEERAKYPSAEEMTAYRQYLASKQTDAEKLASITSERDKVTGDLAKANAEVNKLKHQIFLLSKGVPADDLDYYDFKISQLVTEGKDFETVAKAFLKDKLQQKPSVRVDLGGGFGGGAPAVTGNSAMNAFIRGARK